MVTPYGIKLVFVQKITLNLFLEKSTKTAATRVHFLIPMCTKSFVDWGFALDPTGGAYSAPPDPLLLKGGERRERDGSGGEVEKERGEGRRGEGKGREGREAREFVLCPRKKKKSRRL